MTDAPQTGATPEIAGGILLATLPRSFTSMTKSSAVIPQAQQQQIFDALENDAHQTVPLLASRGLFNAFRMMRLPEIKPAANLEAASLG